MQKRRIFTPAFKAKIVLLVLEGESSMAEICQKYGIKQQIIGRWKTHLLENAASVFGGDKQRQLDLERIAELERLVGRQAMELEILKKTLRHIP